MNQTNQLQCESQHYKFLFEAKISDKKTKVQDCVNGFGEGKELQSHEA